LENKEEGVVGHEIENYQGSFSKEETFGNKLLVIKDAGNYYLFLRGII